MIETAGIEILGNITAEQPYFIFLDASIRLVKRHSPIAQTLHLAADQHQSTLQGVEHQVIVLGFAVLRDHSLVRVGPLRGLLFIALGRDVSFLVP